MPKDQIVLLAGLESEPVRQRVWSFPELAGSVKRMVAAGLLDGGPSTASGNGSARVPAALTDPGMAAAKNIRFITLNDLLAEHLPERA